MKKTTVALKGLSCLLVMNLVCLLLAGCGADGSGEGQSSAAGGSADSSLVSGDGQADIMDNPADNSGDRQVLTVVVTSPSLLTSEARGRITAYNASNPSYYIEMKNYGGGAGSAAAENLETQLTLEILSGKGPDLVIWDSTLYSPALASEKLMENLYDFMDADPDFHREDYYENIMEAFEMNGGLYVLPASFSVHTGCVRADELGTDRGVTDSWTLGEMIEAYENSPRAKMFSNNFTRELQLLFICQNCMGNFVDWSSGECHFDTPEFEELLEWCNTFPESFQDFTYYDEVAKLEAMSSGVIFWQNHSLSAPWAVAYERTTRGGDADLLWPGHPVADGEKELGGGVAAPFGECFSICRNSSNQEAAWEFIKSFLTADAQREVKGIPLLRSVSEERIQDALTVEYETVGGVEREKIKYDTFIVLREDLPVVTIEFSCITENDAETYRSIIEDTHRSYSNDSGILDIILEEGRAYFGGGKDAATVADIIQNRVKIYVSERMK